MNRGAQCAIASRTLPSNSAGSRSSCCATGDYLLDVVAEILEEDDGTVAAGRAGDRAARMSRCPGLVETGDRHAVLRPARHRPARTVVRPAAVAAVDRPMPHVLVVVLDVDGRLDVLREDGAVARHVRRRATERPEVL